MVETSKGTPDERLRTLYDALAESVAEASDEEILAEARDLHEDSKQRAEEIRALLRRAVDSAPAPVGSPALAPAARKPGLGARFAAWFSGSLVPRFALAGLALVGLLAVTAYVWGSRAPVVPEEIAQGEAPSAQQPPATNSVVRPDGVQWSFDSNDGASTNRNSAPSPAQRRPRPHRRATPPAPAESFQPPILRDIDPGSSVSIGDIKTVFVDVMSAKSPDASPTPTARELYTAVVRELTAGSVISAIASRSDSDSRLRIEEMEPSRFRAQFIHERSVLIEMNFAVTKSRESIERQATRVVGEMVAYVKKARSKAAPTPQ